MADRTDFKHIQVTRSDDDVVIVAGVRDAVDPAATSQVQADAPTPEKESCSQSRVQRAAINADADAYRETTLADIEESKMPTAQKIVVVLAIAAMIAFIVWYVVARS